MIKFLLLIAFVVIAINSCSGENTNVEKKSKGTEKEGLNEMLTFLNLMNKVTQGGSVEAIFDELLQFEKIISKYDTPTFDKIKESIYKLKERLKERDEL